MVLAHVLERSGVLETSPSSFSSLFFVHLSGSGLSLQGSRSSLLQGGTDPGSQSLNMLKISNGHVLCPQAELLVRQDSEGDRGPETHQGVTQATKPQPGPSQRKTRLPEVLSHGGLQASPMGSLVSNGRSGTTAHSDPEFGLNSALSTLHLQSW